jgi:hypothetical protein
MSTRLSLHQAWTGLVQPIEGLVVSAPVLADLEPNNHTDPDARAALLAAIEANRASTGRVGITVLQLLRAFELSHDVLVTDPDALASAAAPSDDAGPTRSA